MNIPIFQHEKKLVGVVVIKKIQSEVAEARTSYLRISWKHTAGHLLTEPQ